MKMKRVNKKSKSIKKETSLIKLIDNSDNSNDESEHELSFYVNDRVKLMKEVLKIIKPKKIKSIAPNCLKNVDTEELNSMLLEELLGISNKRLKFIFAGQVLDGDSSSTDSENPKPTDIISLDDVSEDELIIDLDSDSSSTKRLKQRQLDKKKKLKKSNEAPKTNTNNLMTVLELLELQARARAIRSQLALEHRDKDKPTEVICTTSKKHDDSDGDDVVIAEVLKVDEIVISSSESDTEDKRESCNGDANKIIELTLEASVSNDKSDTQDKPESYHGDASKSIESALEASVSSNNDNDIEKTVEDKNETRETENNITISNLKSSESNIRATINNKINNCDNDEIELNLDQSEIDITSD